MDHHPVFQKFLPQQPDVPQDFVQDSFLGTIRRESILRLPDYVPQADRDQDFRSYPHFDEEYYEWVDILESVIDASGTYTFLELGAGFGRWSVRAAFAARSRGGLDIRLVAVEPEHTHFQWLQDHLLSNGLDPGEHILLEAAANDTDGMVSFTVGSGANAESDCEPSRWYGQTMYKGWKATARRLLGALRPRVKPEWTLVKVQAVSLSKILDRCGTVDLADLDVQGAELTVLAAHMGHANERIKRLHIGTHSGAIEVGLRKLLSANGWECLADWPGRQKNKTPFGTCDFGDGVQSWVNPRLS